MKPVGWSVGGHVAVVLLLVALAHWRWESRVSPPSAVAPLQTVLVDASTFRRSRRVAPALVPEVVSTPPPSPPPPTPTPTPTPTPPKPEPEAVTKPVAKPSVKPSVKPVVPPAPNWAAQERLAAEAALEAQLAAEVGRATAVAQGAQEEWNLRLRERIEGKWYRPASARRGLRCRVAVTLVPGGTVVSAIVEECNGDAAVRESLRSAVMSASPLPMPKDPRMFERKIVLEFTPDD